MRNQILTVILMESNILALNNMAKLARILSRKEEKPMQNMQKLDPNFVPIQFSRSVVSDSL